MASRSPEQKYTGHDTEKDRLLQAAAGHDANALAPVVTRTRRAIRIANEFRREQGERGRRRLGITLFALGGILLVLAPVIWGGIDDFVGDEHFSDLPAQVLLISSFLMLAVVGALAIFWRSRASHDS